MLLEDFFTKVYIPRRLRGKSENSVRLYRLCIRQFSKTLGKKAEVSDLTEDNILLHLACRSSVTAATRNKELAELKAMWRLAVQRGIHEGWPDIQPEHEPDRAPIAWMFDELDKLMETAKKQKGWIGSCPASLWWHAFLMLTLETAERVGAIRQVKKGWVQGEWIMFPAESRKGKTRDKSYKLSPYASDPLQALLKVNDEPADVFPWPYSETYLWRRLGRLLKEAGLPVSRKHKFHCLRKTHASVIYKAGMDPQDSLDHSDRRTTQRYLDPRYPKDQQPSDVIAAALTSNREMA